MDSEDYYFVPRDVPASAAVYRQWASVTELFTLWSQSILTARDRLVYGFAERELQAKLGEFAAFRGNEDDFRSHFGVRNTDEFDIPEAQSEVLGGYSTRPC